MGENTNDVATDAMTCGENRAVQSLVNFETERITQNVSFLRKRDMYVGN